MNVTIGNELREVKLGLFERATGRLMELSGEPFDHQRIGRGCTVKAVDVQRTVTGQRWSAMQGEYVCTFKTTMTVNGVQLDDRGADGTYYTGGFNG